MSQLLLHNARVVLEGGVQHGGVLALDGRIAHVFEQEQKPAGLTVSESIDLGGAWLAPGLIDIHIHGSAGVDVQATDGPGLARLSEFLLAEGVTGYFPTLVPTDEKEYRASIEVIGSYLAQQDKAGVTGKQRPAARVLGVHFEGPFVSEHRCGALLPQHFRTYDGDPRSMELFTGKASNIARLITVAPEIRGGLDLTRELSQNGFRVFIGHSQADLETLDLAANAGARHITHFPNALGPLHHRNPGAIGWGLVRRDVTLDCIADFHHVHPLMLRLMYQSKGSDRMALISDGIMPAGLGDGDYLVWGEKIAVREGRTALFARDGHGRLAGSVITMRHALSNIAGLGVPIHEAVRMAGLVPARAAGVEGDIGSITEGKIADLIALDADFAVKLAVIRGAATNHAFG
ncbi:MAG: N-acetylglucosamine-6-phosphate deacetylase [Blastocatellia bacterium]